MPFISSCKVKVLLKLPVERFCSGNVVSIHGNLPAVKAEFFKHVHEKTTFRVHAFFESFYNPDVISILKVMR
jgi:hypothetical protein